MLIPIRAINYFRPGPVADPMQNTTELYANLTNKGPLSFEAPLF